MKQPIYLLSIGVFVLLAIVFFVLPGPPQEEISVYDLCVKGTEVERMLDKVTIQIESHAATAQAFDFLTPAQTLPVFDLLKTITAEQYKDRPCRTPKAIRYIITIQYGSNQLPITFGCIDRGGLHYHLQAPETVYPMLDALCQTK